MCKILCAIALMFVAGCYGPASPETCHARYVRDHPNQYHYERCMVQYRVRAGTATQADLAAYERQLEASRERRARIGQALAAAAEQQRQAEIERANRPCRQWSCQNYYSQTNCRCVYY